MNNTKIICKNTCTILAFKENICTEFKISDMKSINYYLDVKIIQNREKRTLILFQKNYMKKTLILLCRQVSKCNKIDCEMNAQQSSYLPSVHHVMGHVTCDNYFFNKKAVFLMQMYNQLSHMTSAKKKIRKE